MIILDYFFNIMNRLSHVAILYFVMVFKNNAFRSFTVYVKTLIFIGLTYLSQVRGGRTTGTHTTFSLSEVIMDFGCHFRALFLGLKMRPK